MKVPFYSHGFRFVAGKPPKNKLPNPLLLSGGTKQTEKEGTFLTPPAASLTLRDSGNTNDAGHFGECACSVAQPQIPALHRELRPCGDQRLHGAMADLSQNC